MKGKYEEWLTPDGLLKLRAWARDGLVDTQIAHNMGISESTLYEYKRKYPTISEALKRGKEVVDIEVENSLNKSALGYEYQETREEYERFGEELLLVRRIVTTKHMPANLGSICYWLKNRTDGKWSDKPVSDNDSALLQKARELLEGVDSAI